MSYLEMVKKVQSRTRRRDGESELVDTKIVRGIGHSALTDQEISTFKSLNVAVLLSTERYGDFWLIPNDDARSEIKTDIPTILPEELTILQKMEPEAIKGVFLVKKNIPATRIHSNRQLQ